MSLRMRVTLLIVMAMLASLESRRFLSSIAVKSSWLLGCLFF